MPLRFLFNLLSIIPRVLARKVNQIMCDGSKIVKQRQLSIRRAMDRRGISLKAAASDSGIPYPTFASYFPADPQADPVQIPAGAVFSIVQRRALPTDLVSLIMPDGFAIVEVPEGIDHDTVENLARDLVDTKAKAHHKDSPAGREISDGERAELDVKVVALRGAVN